MKKQSHKTILSLLIILSIIGLATSIYLVESHYATPDAGSFCDFSESVSCSLVNTSTFSEVFNVPVSIFGVIWFIILLALLVKAKKNTKLYPALVGWNIIGILSVIYLIIAEIILKALCPFCTVVHVIVAISLILSIILYKSKKQKINIKNYKSWIAIIVILNLLPLIIFNFPTGEKKDYGQLAQCITDKEINMYGSFRCGSCAKTRSMFGDSFEFINEIECHPQGENPQTDLCISKLIEGTPTWILEPNGVEQKRQTGFMNIEELKEFSGCGLE